MKLFRKKETLYGDLVKYSHKTALENPQMILREYEHKINKLNKEIYEHKENKKYYSFQVTWTDANWSPQRNLNIIYREDPSSLASAFPMHRYKGKIKFDKKKIMEFVNVEPEALLEVVNYNASLDGKIVDLQEKLEVLQKEKEKFVKIYIPQKER
jgi:hypothetical protein